MLIKSLQKFCAVPTTQKSSPPFIFFFSLSLTFAAIYGLMALKQAFNAEYVIQDDARQFVFWMQRFIDPTLFPNDLIADFFESVTPWGYTLFYRFFTVLGIEPILLSKLLPFFLGLVITGYLFGISLQILPIPAAAWLVTLLFNQSLWKTDDLISATPRAFGYYLLIVFLYYFLRCEVYTSSGIKLQRSHFFCLFVMALLGIFYPHYLFICTGLIVVQLFDWKNGFLCLSQNPKNYWFASLGLGIFVLSILPYLFKIFDFGPTITVTQAKALSQFSEGRTSFFSDNLWQFFIKGDRSGMLPKGLFAPATLAIGLLLPLLFKFPQKFSLIKHITSNFKLLLQLLFVSLGMFFVAHALLFKLHLPSRYTHFNFFLLIALATGIVLISLLHAVLNWVQLSRFKMFQKVLMLGFTILLCIAIILYPLSWKHFPKSNYVIGQYPALYKFFAQQPKDITIASLADEANNLPTFSHRSVLVSYEYAIPYQLGYYQQIRQRTDNLIRAQYTLNINGLQDFINSYNIDFFVIDSTAFTEEYLEHNPWFKEWKALAQNILANMKQGKIPVIINYLERCSAFEENNLRVLNAKCIARS